jgi:hypothetical protein
VTVLIDDEKANVIDVESLDDIERDDGECMFRSDDEDQDEEDLLLEALKLPDMHCCLVFCFVLLSS